jgi:hypothetical protein
MPAMLYLMNEYNPDPGMVLPYYLRILKAENVRDWSTRNGTLWPLLCSSSPCSWLIIVPLVCVFSNRAMSPGRDFASK